MCVSQIGIILLNLHENICKRKLAHKRCQVGFRRGRPLVVSRSKLVLVHNIHRQIEDSMLGLNCFSVMENPDQDLLLLQSVRRTQGTGNDAAVSSVAEQEEKEKSEPNTQPESNQETLEPRSRPPSLALIEFRIQQLQNRRLILMKMQHLKKKTEDNSGRTTEESE